MKREGREILINFDEVINRKGTYCTQWDYVQDRFGKADLLPFTISDTDFAVPPSVNEAIQKRIQHPIYGYTRWNHSDFKQATQHWFQKRFRLKVDGEWIVYSPSVIYSISQLLQIKSKPGEGVVMQTPAYDAFFKTIHANQRKLVENPLRYQNGQYTIDFADLEEKLADPNNQIMLLCSPHNPTGRVWTTTELQKMVQLCEKYHVFIIADEIHMDVVRKNVHHQNILKYVEKNAALLTSGTKTFNFPGLIFSYLLIPDPELRTQFNYALKNKDGLSSCSILGMEATMAAYKNGSAWVDELNEYVEANVELVRTYLKQHLPQVKLVESEATYLLWLDVTDLPLSMETIQKYCVEVGKVAIMGGGIYGGNGKQFLRLNVGCPKTKVQDGLERLQQSITAALQ